MQNLKILLAVAAIMFASDAQAQEVQIKQNQLPANLSQFVRKHYPTAKISEITREKKLRRTEYEIRLDNGTKLEFQNSKLYEIDGDAQIPNSLLPVKVLQYIQKSYPNTYVTEWKLDNRKQKVELNSGVELELIGTATF